MQLTKITLLSVIVMGLIFSSAFAGGNVEKGKANFIDQKAFGAPGENSCNSCHPDGKGLETSGTEGKKEWKTPVAVLTSLEDAINVCIMMANKGKAIDPKSGEMKDLIAYINSLYKGEATEMKKGMEQKKDEMIEKMQEKMPTKIPRY